MEHSGKMRGDAPTGLHKLAGVHHQPLFSFLIVFIWPVHFCQRFGSCIPVLYPPPPTTLQTGQIPLTTFVGQEVCVGGGSSN